MSEAIQIDEQSLQDSPIQQLFMFESQAEGGYKEVDVDLSQKMDLRTFLITVCQNAYGSNSSRAYNFKADSVVSLKLNELLNNHDGNEIIKRIVEQLSAAENKTVKSGTFIIAKIESNNRNAFLLTKIDFENYLAKGSFELKSGLPEDNGILKSCLVEINKNNVIADKIYLSDKNGKIAQFWYDKFLQSIPVEKDSLNTQKSYQIIKNSLESTVGVISRKDYNELIECVNAYYSTKKTFVFDDFINSVIKSFTPNSPDIKVDDIAKKIIHSKNKSNIDGQFEIVIADVRKLFKRVTKLDLGMELITKGSVKNKVFKSKIKNKYYLVIDTKSGLDEFDEREL